MATSPLMANLLPHNYFAYAHMLIWATQLGSMVWMSFIQGILLFKRLPKQQFSLVQSIVFPTYFICCTAGILSMTAIHYYTARRVDFTSILLLVLETMCLLNQLFIGPETTRLMWKNHSIQRENESATTKGTTPKPTLNKEFAMYHGISSLLNLLIVIGLLVHGVYLTNTVSQRTKLFST